MLVLLPYAVSLADAMLITEDNFLRQLADQLFSKWEKPCCLVMGWVQARLSFAIFWAIMICLQDS